MSDKDIIIKMEKIVKVFPGTIALNKLDFQLYKGEVHAIVGENGAGKSTLMKILSGVYRKDAGKIYFNNQEVEIKGVTDSNKLGISMIYQELENVPKISIAENIFLGRLPKLKLGIVNFRKLYEDSSKILREYNLDFSPMTKLKNLNIGQQQFIEIIKAINIKDSKIIIMDEPTSSLNENETEKLFSIIELLKKKNISIIYISHRLDEVVGIADRVSVFRDGKNIGTLEKENLDKDLIISMMVGHSVEEVGKSKIERKSIIYEAKNINIKNKIYGLSVKLYKGEVLGIAGLTGSGKDELVKSMFGLWPSQSKEIYYKGNKVKINSPQNAVKFGMVYLPEERKTQSLFLQLSVIKNITPLWLNNIYKKFIINEKKELNIVSGLIKKMSIKLSSPQEEIINLSGGNQQKAMFSRLVAISPTIMFLNDPTRGVDVKSKEDIYKYIREMSQSGASFIILSSEIPEIVRLSNRVVVLSKGRICGEFKDEQVTLQNVLRSVTRV